MHYHINKFTFKNCSFNLYTIFVKIVLFIKILMPFNADTEDFINPVKLIAAQIEYRIL